MENTLPCPSCGSGKKVSLYQQGVSRHWVKCVDCEMRGPVRPTVEKAVKGWNDLCRLAEDSRTLSRIQARKADNIKWSRSKVEGTLGALESEFPMRPGATNMQLVLEGVTWAILYVGDVLRQTLEEH